MAQGNVAIDQAAKRAASQNNDLIGVATLVPQTNLPETPSYTQGETLKAQNEDFKGRTPFSVWEPPVEIG